MIHILKNYLPLALVLAFALSSCELITGTSSAATAEAAPESMVSDSLNVVHRDSTPDKYGVAASLFDISEGKVGRRQTLADVLLPLGVSMQEIFLISELPDSLINERKIKPGNAWKFYSPDSLSAENSRIFIYEKDPQHFVRVYIEFAGIRAENGEKVLEQRLRFRSGIIESSLWEAMSENNGNPMVAVELSEIFAWSIDFFGIQQGDKYKVVYEESFVDGRSIGINKVVGAWIEHAGHEFWAIPFIQDSARSFFDEEGNSLRKAFLKAPLRFSRISSGFSHSRMHPVLKIRRPHHGVDYAAATGTPVHTIGDGVIIKRGYQARGGGNYIKIRHNSVYSTTYMHLHGFAKGMTVGHYVKQGETIGYVGATGLATGPHLDFRFYKNGSPVNPLKVEAPPVEPIKEENLQAYALARAFSMSLLNLL